MDKRLIAELARDCRVPLRGLARTCKLSATSIKKRLTKLRAGAVLGPSYIELSLAMLDAHYSYAWLTTDGSEHDEEFLDALGTYPGVHTVARLGSKRVHAISAVAGSEGLSELGRFFRHFDCVTSVEIGLIHPLAPSPAPETQSALYRGRKVAFTPSQLSVIACLWDDVRMPAKEIARRTRLSSHSVKRVLRELQTEGGLYFTMHPCFHAARLVPFALVTDYDDRQTQPESIAQWLATEFPFEYCNTWHFANKPELIHFCIANDLPTIERITNLTKNQLFVTSVETSIIRAFRFFYGLGYIKLAELLGRSVQNGQVPLLAE